MPSDTLPTRLLIVDDDATSRMLMRKTLERAGFEVKEAVNGADALEKFVACKPAMILLDVEMPEMDGFTACAKLREMPEGEHVPVLMVTGLEDVDSVNRAYQVGATDFTSKPINFSVLGHRVRYMLRASQAFHQTRISEMQTRALLQAIPDSMLRMSFDGEVLSLHLGQDAELPFNDEQLVHHRISDVLGEAVQTGMLEMLRVAKESSHTQATEVDYPPDSPRNYEVRLVVSGQNEAVAVIRDITDRKEAENRMRQLAYLDSLTGLANRQLFSLRLQQALEQPDAADRQVAVFLMDLDVFHRINDTLGHHMGDLLLRGVGARLRRLWVQHAGFQPELDNEDEPPAFTTVARMGGDEFAMLVDTADSDHDQLLLLAQGLMRIVAIPLALSGQEVVVTPSVGIAVGPADGKNVESLLMNADTAMNHAKKGGRNKYQFYNQQMNARSKERLALENRLRKGIEQDELVLHYQPQIVAETGVVSGVEALVRWNNPDLGLVSPGEFIPLAEETGLILPLGQWVLETAARQAKIWYEAGIGPMHIAVNLAGQQFQQKNFSSMLSHLVQRVGVPAGCLELEITEGTIMSNAEETIVTLRELKDMGFALSIDDFGTGYSSLSYLKRFPLDYLKIDQAFVRDVTTNPEDAGIVRAIIAMAKSLKLRTIAEGVETNEHVEFLRIQGADILQGYYYSKPVDAEACEAFIRSHQPGQAN